MRARIPVFLFLLLLTGLACKSAKNNIAYSSEKLKILPLSQNSFIHVSYLQTDSFGKVACNGLVYMNGNEAVVVDTPVDAR